VAKLGELGDVMLQSGGRTSIREIRAIATSPGYGWPVAATFEYRELYARGARAEWDLVRYSYEYRTVDGGRRAYHLHDQRFHAHCVDPRESERDHHHRSPEIDLFEAHDEFRRSYISGITVSCGDLRPALD
jgi:hypothetical protein